MLFKEAINIIILYTETIGLFVIQTKDALIDPKRLSIFLKLNVYAGYDYTVEPEKGKTLISKVKFF